ncbi:MAG: S-adenosylmethionine synthetase [Candidatus Harrisonbacteria bacterium CG10_big_fil_rev_8_21_14_0_10_45_28]|uniref:S-adenosylmethionine synthetase n=1 Tax=Candidatus Harrisonbacteria bacterium CG10_big_fil_rev_8_21_14_0_10_45_28 TaxID=1974586 RepID=A0A2H0UME9_9BACT|nr:MAG: S-adenosylmethionine synthetase [Candidatus Harrisonbacteria bacterium CG10_big_fil_rev_8_21_14_0_10_45_28]
MNLYIKENSTSLNQQPTEVAERKGLGHPDTIADGIAESISLEYSKYCLENFGAILHHNVDKTIVLGGQCDLEYGRGELLKPFRVLFGGRMSQSFGNQEIDIKTIQITAAKNYLQKVLPRLNDSKDLEFHTFTSSNSRISHWFSPRTIDDLPEHKNPHANDTATIVGFWPLSVLEQMVLASERYFYDFEQKIHPRFDFVGGDIKIMALRRGQEVELTLCIPFHADKVKNQKEYFERKSLIENGLQKLLEEKFGSLLNTNLQINTQDQKIKSDNDDGRGRYLTVIGSALDYGEEGISGRGNRCRGLISSMRPSTVESVYGKNPVYHVGKIYSLIANTIAQQIDAYFDCEATIIITTRNGDPLYSPYNVLVETSKTVDKQIVQKIIASQLEKRDWTNRIVTEGIFLPENELRYEK